MINGYEPLLVETDGGLICRDCLTFCYFGSRLIVGCDVDGCTCEQCAVARRAVDLDEQPAMRHAI